MNEGEGTIAKDHGQWKIHGTVHNAKWVESEEKEFVMNSCL